MSKTLQKSDNDFVAKNMKIINNLDHLMTEVTKDQVTADTVNAACQCAEKITDLFKFHLDLEKHKLKISMIDKVGLNNDKGI